MSMVINHNSAALTALNSLGRNTLSMNRSIERLSTGFKINRASDGPAALVISERLRAQVAGLRQAVDNSERAQNMIATAEAAMVEMNALLIDIQDLVIEVGNNLSNEEILANQAQVDDAINTINRIANTTNFAGTDLLNGEVGYVLQGINSNLTGLGGISEIDVQGAAIRGSNSQITYTVRITQDASQAIVGSARIGGANQTIGSSGASLLVRGNTGTELIEFNTSALQSDVVAAVNAVSDSTGVTAVLSATAGTNRVYFQSVGYGSDQFVEVQEITTNKPNSQYVNAYDEGGDLAGTVNGISFAGDGLKLSIDTFEIDADITMSSTFFTNNHTISGTAGSRTSAATTSFTVIDGGMRFKLGAGDRPTEDEYFGITRMGADNLGSRDAGGFLSDIKTGGSFTLLNDSDTAYSIIQAAIDDITGVRARLGAFQANTLESNINSLNINIENLAAAESRIRDTDFAEETAELTKNQILVQAGTAVLAQANAFGQNALALLAF